MKSWQLTYILGGGRSAGVFDLSKLRQKGFLLGVQRAGLCASCDAVFAMDRIMMRNWRKQFEEYDGEVYVCLPKCYFEWAPQNAIIFNRIGDAPPTLQPHTISSGYDGAGNSGLCAMNLAAHKHAKTIVLLGFDLDKENANWFGLDPGKRPTRDKILENFSYCAEWYKKRNIKVLNANPGSYIKDFEFIAYNEVYEL